MIKKRGKLDKSGGPGRYVGVLGISLLLLSLSFLYGCGGGAGGASEPGGNSPGVAHTLQLFPEKNVAQTGSYVYLRAKLMDGNGNPIVGATVNFTNESIIGTLYAAGIEAASATITAVTDGNGVASVRIRSTTPGFANVVAEHAGLRDMRSIYFTTNDTLNGYVFNPISVYLEVDGDGDGVYNETEDFNINEYPGDDTVVVRATVSALGALVAGVDVTFTADNPDATFPGGTDVDGDGLGDYKISTTDSFGQAYATVKVIPSGITNAVVVLNIQAVTDYIFVPEFDASFAGASMVSLFLQPVVIDFVDIYANPDVVEVGADSELTIGVRLNTGEPAPDGTSVQLTIDNPPCGSIDTPFVQTTDGNATATFTAPSAVPAGGICTVTATAGGVSASVDIVIVEAATALALLPSTATITDPQVNDTFDFLIVGGTAPYTALSSNTSLVTVAVSGTTLTATVVGVPAADTDVTITVVDDVGNTATATLTLDVP